MSAQLKLCTARAYPPLAFRKACAAFPTGVAVVAIQAVDGSDTGMVINSFASVSLQPMLVQWAVACDAPNYALYAHTERYGLSLLAANQAALVPRFTRGGRKFDGLPVLRSAAAMRWLPGATAHFCCRVVQRVPAGDHLLLIGEVTEFAASGGAPLLFIGGQLEAWS
ncbi:MAG: flavin reductase family protein [Burkholderiaceae bacterium]|nr:flavin reductase family protein [Burkholderiaceae bacterium]